MPPMHNLQIGVSLAVHVPIYLNYVVIAVWFFCHAAMELTLIIFTGSSIKSRVSFLQWGMADRRSNWNDHILGGGRGAEGDSKLIFNGGSRVSKACPLVLRAYP